MTAVMNESSLTNFAGVGSTLEGLHNQSMYEFVFDRAWAGSQCDATNWLRLQARCRVGGDDAAVESAFETFWFGAMGGDKSGDHAGDGSGGDVFQMVPRLAPGSKRGYLGEAKTFRPIPIATAWEQMLGASPDARKHDGYRNDLAEITRAAMTAVGDGLRRSMFDAYTHKDAAAFKLEARFLESGRDMIASSARARTVELANGSPTPAPGVKMPPRPITMSATPAPSLPLGWGAATASTITPAAIGTACSPAIISAAGSFI